MRTVTLRTFWSAAALALLSLLGTVSASASALIPGTLTGTLPIGDDVSNGPVPLGLGGAGGINLFGQLYSNLYVNNNGNVTFGSPLTSFVENGLEDGVGVPILAPFFADVDTAGAGAISYGNLTVNGRSAFAVDWTGVGYYSRGADKTNTFQLVLVDRSDTGAGNFDMEFNYGQIQWETGNGNGGTDGLGGISAAAGYSDGQSLYYELTGSLVNGAFLDGGPNALVANTLGSSGLAGRYDFQVRGGQVSVPTPVPEPSLFALAAVGLAVVAVLGKLKSAGRGRPARTKGVRPT